MDRVSANICGVLQLYFPLSDHVIVNVQNVTWLSRAQEWLA